MYLNIVLENQNGTLDYNEFDNLQEEIQYRYLKYLDYIGLNDNKLLN